MAFYDEASQTVTLRIVYDGLGTAGKTTNVQKLHELYTLHRNGPVVTPEAIRGRTAYFDWLELTTGMLDERYPLRCQVLTVPGQFAYAPRRWKLLTDVDAVVCVCDSGRQGIKRARLGLDFLRELRARGVCPDVPVLVQANKRDAEDAVSLEELGEVLALTDERVIEAVATQGYGVRLTFMLALDAARRRVRAMIAEGGVAALNPSAPTPEQLLEHLQRELESEDDAAYALVDALAASVQSG